MRVADLLDKIPLSAALGSGTVGDVKACIRDGLLRLENSREVTLTRAAGSNFEAWVVDVVGGDIPLAALGRRADSDLKAAQAAPQAAQAAPKAAPKAAQVAPKAAQATPKAARAAPKASPA